MKCFACGKELTRKEAVYTDEKLPYCPNPFTCNDNHPNSVTSIIARQGAAKMFTEEELEVNTFDKLNVTPEMKKRIMKVATKPQSIRLFKVDIAYYVLQLQESKGLSSISEAVRYCIERTRELEPLNNEVENIPEESSDKVEVIEKSKGVKIVTQAKPSINVNWNEIDKQRKAAKPEPQPEKDEDELVF